MGSIRFQYRALHDVVIAYVDWTLETQADVSAWHAEYDAYFRPRFSRKVDLILELSKFHFNPVVADSFARSRIQVLSEYTIRSYRVQQSVRERTFMYTSSARRGTPANHYESIDEALKALLEDRAKAADAAVASSPAPAPPGKGGGAP
jgi:hypothetical protein